MFRDREDFPAAADLSQWVKQALAVSHALVVLCSPEAKASPWVAKEIALFRELHPDRPILAALVRGEPAEAFPDPLTQGAEPLAADLRRGGDGQRLGFLKIVAGLAGVPLDALVQRDAQRRVRRVTAVTLASLAAVLIMAAMTVIALNSRNEAQRQRAEAEGLIEYMLTDLRTELRGRIGQLDVMTNVNERAMAYYEDQGDLSDLPAESLERRARILHAMGEDNEKRGDLDKALAKFREAHRVTAEQLAREPNNPDRIFAHGQSEYWVGYIAYRKKDWPLTTRHWRAYRELAEGLVAADADNPEWLREAGYAEGNLCTLELESKDLAEAALKSCQAALERMLQVRTKLPNEQKAIQDVANRFAWLSDAWQANGNTGRAVLARARQERLVAQLVERDPGNIELQDQWMRTLMSNAEFLFDRNRRPEAQAYRDRAQAVVERLIKRDPDNERWRYSSQRIAAMK